MRASGAIPTDARWMRDFVDAHPDYQHDSRVPDTTLYDLMKHVSILVLWEIPEKRGF